MTEISADALLFDMDGVLIDSIAAVDRVWRQWAVEHGFDPDEVTRRAHGRPSLTTIREYLPGADHAAENREVERRELAELAGITPLPGAAELLAALPRARWCIVTSCTRPLGEARWRAGGLPPPEVFLTASDITHGKPHPEPYLKAAAALGVPPARCVVVEDVPAGVRAGKASGARVIGISAGKPAGELAAAGADWVVADCAAIRVAPRAPGDTMGLHLILRPDGEAEREAP